MKALKKVGFSISSLLAGSAMAAGPDVSSLTTAVDFSTVSTAIMTVSGSIISVYIVIKAAQFIIGRVKGA